MVRSQRIDRETYETAARRAREEDAVDPRAIAAGYDESKDALVLELRCGVLLEIPRKRIPGLGESLNIDLLDVAIEGRGEYLRWPRLDVDHSVPILLANVLGIRTIVENARRAGSVTSAAKAAAVRENGKKGGRPRKKDRMMA